MYSCKLKCVAFRYQTKAEFHSSLVTQPEIDYCCPNFTTRTLHCSYYFSAVHLRNNNYILSMNMWCIHCCLRIYTCLTHHAVCALPLAFKVSSVQLHLFIFVCVCWMKTAIVVCLFRPLFPSHCLFSTVHLLLEKCFSEAIAHSSACRTQSTPGISFFRMLCMLGVEVVTTRSSPLTSTVVQRLSLESTVTQCDVLNTART